MAAERLHETMLAYSRMKRDRLCFASQTTLAADVGCSRRTVIRQQQILEAAGLIVRQAGRRFRTVVWRVVRPMSHNAYGKPSTRTAGTPNTVSGRGFRCSGSSRATKLSTKKRWRPRMTAGQDLTAHFVDECTEQGRPEMVRALKGQVAQRAKILLRDGCSVDELKAAITEFVRRRGTTALALGEIVLELHRNQDPDPTLRPENRRRAKQWIEEHGWPTGATFVRGSHAGHYKRDVLGTDRVVEQDWPHSKPSFDEIVRALA